MQRYNCKTPPATVKQNTISANRKAVELYLRYNKDVVRWDKHTLVIARLSFDQRRKGNGMDLLRFFAQKSREYKYTKIGIEEANANSIAFARKFGFKKQAIEGDWIVGVNELESKLV